MQIDRGRIAAMLAEGGYKARPQTSAKTSAKFNPNANVAPALLEALKAQKIQAKRYADERAYREDKATKEHPELAKLWRTLEVESKRAVVIQKGIIDVDLASDLAMFATLAPNVRELVLGKINNTLISITERCVKDDLGDGIPFDDPIPWIPDEYGNCPPYTTLADCRLSLGLT